MIKIIRPYLLFLGLVLICIILSVSSTLLLIPLSKRLPEIFSSSSINGFIGVSIGVILIYTVKGLFTYLQNYFTGLISIKSTSALRKEIYRLILNDNFQSFSVKKTGELITVIVDDINKIRELIFSFISEFLPSVITLFFTVSYIFYLNWRLSIFVFLLIPAIGGLIGYFSKQIKEKSELIQNKVADSYSVIYENFINYLIIKIFALESLKSEQFSQIEEYNNTESLASIRLISLQPSIIGVVQVTGICIIACYGGNEIINHRLTLPELLAFGTALSLTIDPVIYLTKSLGIIHRSRASKERVEKLRKTLLSEQSELFSPNNGKKITYFKNYKIECKNLNFKYDEISNAVLSELNLNINQGSYVAISGDNGCGKTTLNRLFLGLYKNFQGEIYIGGNNIFDYDLETFRQNVKACIHEPFLFNGTIRENLLIGLHADKSLQNKKQISDAELDKVCLDLKISEFSEKMENDIDTYIGEFGNKLSSGQKQRIAIARAVISGPKILILDEATSALDLETEKQVYKAIRSYLPESTIIIINHRKASIEFVDEVFYLGDT
jgi:subfamily B ATP-binding cassette protein MsbA